MAHIAEPQESSAAKLVKGSGELCGIHVEPAENGFVVEIVKKQHDDKDDTMPMRKSERKVYGSQDIEKLLDEMHGTLTAHLGAKKRK